VVSCATAYSSLKTSSDSVDIADAITASHEGVIKIANYNIIGF